MVLKLQEDLFLLNSTGPDGKDFRDTAATFTAYDTTKAQEALDAGLKELGVSSIKLRLTYGTDESPMDQLATYLQNSFSKLKGLEIEMVATTKQDRIYTKMETMIFVVLVGDQTMEIQQLTLTCY